MFILGNHNHVWWDLVCKQLQWGNHQRYLNNKILAFSHYDFPVWYHYREQELYYRVPRFLCIFRKDKINIWMVCMTLSDIFFLSLAHNIYRDIPVQKTHPFIIFFIVFCICSKYIFSVGVCNLKVFLAMISDDPH